MHNHPAGPVPQDARRKVIQALAGTVISAEGLYQAGKREPDTFVTVRLITKKGKCKSEEGESQTVKRSRDPVWNLEFFFEEFPRELVFELIVWQKERNDRPLGRLALRPADVEVDNTDPFIYDLEKPPNWEGPRHVTDFGRVQLIISRSFN